MVDWTKAECAGLWEWFFPLPGESLGGDIHRKWVCKLLCSGCVLRKECTALGAEIEEETHNSRYSSWGIWGGLERRELLAK